jgi:hypothetical protein
LYHDSGEESTHQGVDQDVAALNTRDLRVASRGRSAGILI